MQHLVLGTKFPDLSHVRHEWVILGLDKYHIPSAAFHWTLYWLVCEGGVVEDYIQFCFRRVRPVFV